MILSAVLIGTLISSPNPITFPFQAVQCVPVRDVVCVVDKDYPQATCELQLRTAVDAINDAVGREILHFAGFITPAGLEHAYLSGVIPVAGLTAADLPKPNILALTVPHVALDRQGWPCITRALIFLGPVATGLEKSSYAFNGVWILEHELIHALGALDVTETHFKSRMEAAYPRDLTTGLSEADKRTLRYVYGD